jgi:type I restriction enzyme, S subunit
MSELLSTWARSTIGDVAQYIQRGKSPQYTDHSTLPIINQKCIRWDELQLQHLKYIHPDQFEAWDESRYIRPGDILWNSTGTGTVGRAYLVKEADCTPPKVVDTHVTIVRPTAGFDARYLFNWIKSPAVQSKIEEMCDGATNQIELSRATIAATEIPVAPREEQVRIANQLGILLASVNACNDRLDAIPGILKRFRQAVLINAFMNALMEEDSINATYRRARISEIANVGTGSTPLRSNGRFFSISGTPWVTSAATGTPLIQSAEQYVTEDAITAHRLKIYPQGTLLVAMYGEGKTRGQVSELGIAATINQACAAITVDETQAFRKYVKLALTANYLTMRKLAEGGSQLNLNLSKIKEFEIPLPPLDEQAEIVERVDAFFALADTIEAHYAATRAHAERLTPRLLAKAFRGELVAQDPNDEPASALLVRIAAVRAAAPASLKTTSSRKPRTRRTTTAPKETATMTKSRHDDDVKGKPYLAKYLRRVGKPVAAEELFKMAELPIADFYKQLVWEVNAGLIKDQKTALEATNAA